jgi:TRAP-type C4-dicarboxylate transport system permease small subunit
MNSAGKRVAGIINWISRTFFRAGYFFLLALVAIITMEVIARRVLGKPTSWSFDVSTYLMVLIIFLPVGYVTQIRRHISVTFLYDRVPPKTRSIFDVIAPVLALGWAGILTWQTGKLAYNSLRFGWTSGTQLDIPIGYLQLIVPLGAFFLCLEWTLILIYSITTLLSGRPAPGSPEKEGSK